MIKIKFNLVKHFLAYLLELLVSWPYFCFIGLVSLIVGLAIEGAVLIALKVSINLFK